MAGSYLKPGARHSRIFSDIGEAGKYSNQATAVQGQPAPQRYFQAHLASGTSIRRPGVPGIQGGNNHDQATTTAGDSSLVY
jgi:hypothetical protein